MTLINIKSKKRGLSSIIGTLLMVAVVATIGSVILFQALNGINDFNFYLSFLTGSKDSLLESVIIEHVRFNPTTDDLDVWVRNTGTVQINIAKISVVKMDSQELIPIDDSTPNTIISISELVNIPQQATITGGAWDDCVGADYYCSARYRISITTSSGNSFETFATPFNT